MERFITVYSFSDEGLFLGTTKAQRDKNGEVMLPIQSTLKKPLDKEGYNAYFNGDRWFYRQIQESVPAEDVQEPTELTYAEKRLMAYPIFGDQLDALFKGFQYLRDEGEQLPEDTLSWLSEIEEVKAKYPKVAT